MIKRFLDKLKRKKKKYNMPYKFGFIKWSPSSIKLGLSIKRIELYEGNEEPIILPFMSYRQVSIIEKNMGYPIFDMTQGEAMPSGEVIDVWNPAELDIIW